MTYPKATTHPDDAAQGGVPSTPRFPQIEEGGLAFWEADDTFRATVEQRDAGEDGDNQFVFYDGPPFANRLPHHGHLPPLPQRPAPLRPPPPRSAQGPNPARPTDARPPGRAPLRLGHPRPAGR